MRVIWTTGHCDRLKARLSPGVLTFANHHRVVTIK
jgi:hypothetical protein